MQLTFLLLVLCCVIPNSSTNPPLSGTSWRRSRYIIDNRRNALFAKKSSTALLPAQEDTKESGSYEFKPILYPVDRTLKDLAAEASISEPKFYRKYGDNIPRKIIKSYRLAGNYENHPNEYIFADRKNTSEVLDPQNFIQNEEDVGNEVASKTATTTEKMLTWVPVSSTATTSKDLQKTSPTREFEFGIPTTASYPWEITKPEQANQIDNNEKHVYETRIETVSYHQEVIFNPPKKPDWYQGDRTEPKNYERPEVNYEEPEKNYEEPEKNYEEPEQNYEEQEKDYELDERMTGGEDNKNKFGYVVEGSNYRKYRVEERTVDGFIVGEYGVVSHDDGSLRGVRYTADGNTNPKLIYETLIKFLSL